MPAPEVYVIHPEAGTLLAHQRAELEAAEIIDQLVVADKKGEQHHIKLFPGMNPEELKAKYDAIPVKEPREIQFNCDEEHTESYRELIRAALSLELKPGLTISPGMVRFKFVVGDHYFRAIAKIGFHYYLTQTSRALGNEECFAPIRHFIMQGGDIGTFFSGPRIFTTTIEAQFASHAPAHWHHFLAACERENEVTGYVRLFFGPRARGTEYHVRIGRLASSLLLPDSVWAHAYAYDRPPFKGRKVGETVPISLTRFR